jgi:hypothetical protein
VVPALAELSGLASSCQAITEGRIPTVMKPARIYPVCVSDEPAVESFFFTTYSNEVFQKEVTAGLGIQPVTIMSVNELEEILPYVSAGSFSWEELLDFRLNNLSGAFSVHQAIYDLVRQKGLPTIKNEKVRVAFDEAWRTINSRFKAPVALSRRRSRVGSCRRYSSILFLVLFGRGF